VSLASCMHARCIPSGSHGHMRQNRLAASCSHGRGAGETCKCHHVNRWGSRPSVHGDGGQAWREKEREPEPCCCRMHADSEVKKESGFCLLLQLSWHCRIDWHGIHCSCMLQRERRRRRQEGRRPDGQEFTCDHHPFLSLHPRERWSKKI